jgi:ectoine hydroxylase-related dioxygenase (phytanoyl-CoA dioxygenase family)
MHLSQSQVSDFRRDGYLPIPWRLIEPGHLAVLRERYDRLFAERRGTTGQGLRNLSRTSAAEQGSTEDGGEEMLQIMQMWTLDDDYRRLLYHAPLLDIVESLIGSDIQLFHDQALWKPAFHGGEVPWHQDNAYWRCQPAELVTIWLALDDADEQNGCMHVIPGSHLSGHAEHTRAETERGPLPALLTALVEGRTRTPVPVRAGYGMAHHCLTLHWTPPNRSPRPRRAMAIHYMSVGTRNARGDVMSGNPLLRGNDASGGARDNA